MIRVTVPAFRKVQVAEKTFTVFLIDVTVSNNCQRIEKRYSEFEDLHKQLKKKAHTPHFPPKKVLKWNQKVLEDRRAGLEHYLQGVLQQEIIPKLVLKFLDITNHRLRTASFDSLERCPQERTTHQPILGFTEDPFLYEASSNSSKGSLPDIVAQGTHIGLYGEDHFR